jgi:hypothetical protein
MTIFSGCEPAQEGRGRWPFSVFGIQKMEGTTVNTPLPLFFFFRTRFFVSPGFEQEICDVKTGLGKVRRISGLHF